jgi:hypothetical protein
MLNGPPLLFTLLLVGPGLVLGIPALLISLVLLAELKERAKPVFLIVLGADTFLVAVPIGLFTVGYIFHGAMANNLVRETTPLIENLEASRETQGHYPGRLPETDATAHLVSRGLDYRLDGNTYSLSFPGASWEASYTYDPMRRCWFRTFEGAVGSPFYCL